MPPVALSEEVRAASGVEVSIDSISRMDVEARGAGEIGGPGIRVAVRVVNASDQELDLTALVADASFGPDRVPGLPVSGSGAVPLSGALAPGDSKSGTYDYLLPTGVESTLYLAITFSERDPVALLVGRV